MGRLKFHLYYPHNLFFLIDNLSGWSRHCRIFYRKHFVAQYKFLKPNLNRYVKIRKKYGWGKIEPIFIKPTLQIVRKNLAKLPKGEKLFLQNILNSLNKKYGKELKSKCAHLQPKIIQLKKAWYKIEKRVITFLETFNDLQFPKKINVFVLFRPEGTGSGGGANLGKLGITIEVGGGPIRHDIETLIHELKHYLEIANNKSAQRELTKLGLSSKGELNNAMIANEAITGLLAPNGFLSETIRLSKFKLEPWHKPDKYKIKLAKFKRKLAKIVKNYFENKKGRNYYKDFLPQVAKVLK